MTMKRLALALSSLLLAGAALASTYTSSDLAHRFNGTIYATDSSLAGTATATNGFTTAEGGTIAFTNDVKLVRDTANALGLRNGTSAQTLNIYNTWANAGVDYELLRLLWSGNTAYLQTLAGGSGTLRSLILDGSYLTLATGHNGRWTVGVGGDFTAASDNTYNIGKLAAPKEVWVANSIQYGRTKVLTNGTATTICWMSVPNTNRVSGKLVYEINATDGTDTQGIMGECKFTAGAKATVVSSREADVQTAADCSGGTTLTAVVAGNVATNNVYALSINATSSLTTTNVTAKWRIETPSTFTINALANP